MNLWSANLIYECLFSFEQEDWCFYTFSHAGQGAVLIKEALILLAWLIQARITAGSHLHNTVIAGQRHLLLSETSSLKPGMLEDFTLTNTSYYPQNKAAVHPCLRTLKSIDVKTITYTLLLLVASPGSPLFTHHKEQLCRAADMPGTLCWWMKGSQRTCATRESNYLTVCYHQLLKYWTSLFPDIKLNFI